MFQAFILKLLVEAVKNPEIRGFAMDLVERLVQSLLPKLVALFPVFGGSLLKQAFELVPNLPDIGELDDAARGVAQKILESDPDIPGLSDIVDLSELLRGFLR